MSINPFPRFPEIALVKRRPEIFAVKEVVAHEKLHGSQFRLHFPIGMQGIQDIKFGSHEEEYSPVSVPGKKFPLGAVVKRFQEEEQDLLGRMLEVIGSYGFTDATVYGEAYGPGIKAKGVRYSTGQKGLFRVFGIMVGQNLFSDEFLTEVTEKMKLPRVHEVWRGAPSLEAFDALLEKPSVEGKLNGIEDEMNIAEGVVIQSVPLLRNVFGEWLMVKHKAKRFSEVAEAPAEPKVRGVTPADTFAMTYVTEGRVRNAVGRLQDRDEDSLKGDMTDMPVLLDEMIADLHKECEPEWVAMGLPDKQVRGAVSKVLAPIYRQFLTT